MLDYSIAFPNLHIELPHVGKSIDFFGFEIAYYGIIIAIGMLVAMMFLSYETRRLQENTDTYYSFAMYVIIFGFIGARIYYVAFSWQEYRHDLLSILNFRGGGIALYGGLIGAALTALIFTKIKKLNFFRMTDIAIICLLIGQIFGRWGNFFNREAFGEYTNSLFAMRLPMSAVRNSEITILMRKYSQNGYIQVTPTFLYESLWNLALLVFLLFFRKHKKYDGQVLLLYLVGYGIGRFWIESLRTDQLCIPVIGWPVSMVVSVIFATSAAVILIIKAIKGHNRKEIINNDKTA